MTYSPSSKTEAKETLVKWTNKDGAPHTVTANNKVLTVERSRPVAVIPTQPQ